MAAIAVAVLVVAVLGIGLALPPEYDVERARIIKSPVSCPYEHVVDLERHLEWGPWKIRDPSMEVEMGEVTRGVGATYRWTSDASRDVEVEILEMTPMTRVETRITIDDGAGHAAGVWTFEPEGNNTKVTWHVTGEISGVMNRYFSLFVHTMGGGDLDAALQRLAQVCERPR